MDVVIKYGQIDWRPQHKDPAGFSCEFSENQVGLHWDLVGTFLVRDGREIIVDPVPDVDEQMLRLLSGPALTRTTYGERVQALTKALEAYMPKVVDYAIPGGGYFFWLTCSPHVDAEKLLPLANEAGVSYRPGQAFSATRGFSNAMRLSFALYESEELEQGIARLANAFKVYQASTLL